MEQELSISSKLVNQYFGMEIPEESLSYQLILENLTGQVGDLLNRDFQALLNALYRIDVDERKFAETLETGNPATVAERVAKLILDRIILKAQNRLKYSM